MKRLFAIVLTLALVMSCAPAISIQVNAETYAAVHTNGNVQTQYKTVEEALNTAINGTITLLADASVDSVLVKPGVTLDLNGKTLTADVVFVFAGGTIQDGGENCTGGGLLKVSKESILYAKNDAQNIIPVYNGTDGYIFTKVTFLQTTGASFTDGAQYIFLPVFTNEAASALMADGGADNGLKIKACLTWNEGQSQQFYTYSEDLVKQVFDGTGRWVFDLTVTGITGIADMVASPMVVCDCIAQASTTGTAVKAA